MGQTDAMAANPRRVRHELLWRTKEKLEWRQGILLRGLTRLPVNQV
jgi:hypothetical protein